MKMHNEDIQPNFKFMSEILHSIMQNSDLEVDYIYDWI